MSFLTKRREKIAYDMWLSLRKQNPQKRVWSRSGLQSVRTTNYVQPRLSIKLDKTAFFHSRPGRRNHLPRDIIYQAFLENCKHYRL